MARRDGRSERSFLDRDIGRLLCNRSPEARIDALARSLAALDDPKLAAGQRERLERVILRLATDIDQTVREAAAWKICRSPLLSPALARRLGRDLGTVAFPILRHVETLPDFFLRAMIRDGDGLKLMAVAARDDVSPKLCDALVEGVSVKAVERLLRNPGAALAPRTLHRALDRFGVIAMIPDAMAGRRDLPRDLAERLMTLVGDELRDELAQRHDLFDSPMRRRVADEPDAPLLLKPLDPGTGDVEELARQLHADGVFGAGLLLRALCGGDIALFLAGLAVRAGIEIKAAARLAFDRGPLGLGAVFELADLGHAVIPAFRAALWAMIAIGYSGADRDGKRGAFQRRAVAEVFNRCAASPDQAIDDVLTGLFDQRYACLVREAAAAARREKADA
jgi:uncharacterized protein (DUF2336 family)